MGEPKPEYPDPESPISSRIGDSKRGYWHHPRGGPEGNNWVPDYFSTTITAAFRVVEHMGRDGFDFSLWRSDDGQKAYAGFNCPLGPCKKHGNPIDNWHGSRDIPANSVPLAICKAALVALGYET